ncbi:Protein CFT1 [Zancudomyces culisetae]|uniref:Protein CFT1 n=1 Tax=Zancudomyces culisetae TaxID=1213189 RepID=A0A1R1PRT4_ZANCU|nr:Protein CFT1 [Zancudomyces culisetae]|eukprot:OMH83664.1 Protein CFT1 [Zancudomyces culisetae]
MYTYCKEIVPPSSVDFSVTCRFTRTEAVQLVLVRGTMLEVFEFDETNRKLVLLREWRLHGIVRGLAVVEGGKSKELKERQLDGEKGVQRAKESSGERDRLAISFEEAKLSIIEFEEETQEIVTKSIHYYEQERYQRQESNRQNSGRIRKEERCMIMEVNCGYMAILPMGKSTYKDNNEEFEMEQDFMHEIEEPNHEDSQKHKRRKRKKREKNRKYTASMVIDMYEEYGIENIRDFEFLKGYNEPTVAILYEPNKSKTWAGNLKQTGINSCKLVVGEDQNEEDMGFDGGIGGNRRTGDGWNQHESSRGSDVRRWNKDVALESRGRVEASELGMVVSTISKISEEIVFVGTQGGQSIVIEVGQETGDYGINILDRINSYGITNSYEVRQVENSQDVEIITVSGLKPQSAIITVDKLVRPKISVNKYEAYVNKTGTANKNKTKSRDGDRGNVIERVQGVWKLDNGNSVIMSNENDTIVLAKPNTSSQGMDIKTRCKTKFIKEYEEYIVQVTETEVILVKKVTDDSKAGNSAAETGQGNDDRGNTHKVLYLNDIKTIEIQDINKVVQVEERNGYLAIRLNDNNVKLIKLMPAMRIAELKEVQQGIDTFFCENNTGDGVYWGVIDVDSNLIVYDINNNDTNGGRDSVSQSQNGLEGAEIGARAGAGVSNSSGIYPVLMSASRLDLMPNIIINKKITTDNSKGNKIVQCRMYKFDDVYYMVVIYQDTQILVYKQYSYKNQLRFKKIPHNLFKYTNTDGIRSGNTSNNAASDMEHARDDNDVGAGIAVGGVGTGVDGITDIGSQQIKTFYYEYKNKYKGLIIVGEALKTPVMLVMGERKYLRIFSIRISTEHLDLILGSTENETQSQSQSQSRTQNQSQLLKNQQLDSRVVDVVGLDANSMIVDCILKYSGFAGVTASEYSVVRLNFNEYFEKYDLETQVAMKISKSKQYINKMVFHKTKNSMLVINEKSVPFYLQKHNQQQQQQQQQAENSTQLNGKDDDNEPVITTSNPPLTDKNSLLLLTFSTPSSLNNIDGVGKNEKENGSENGSEINNVEENKNGYEIIDEYDKFEVSECITSIKTMYLESQQTDSQVKEFVVIGTTLVNGEDLASKGYIYIFDIVDIVPQIDKPYINKKLKLLTREEMRGGVSCLAELNNLLVVVVGGNKMYLRSYNDTQGYLTSVAFMDLVGCGYCSHISTIKNYLLLSDYLLGGIYLLAYQEEPISKLVLLSKYLTSPTTLPSLSTSASNSGSTTINSFVHMYIHNPETLSQQQTSSFEFI